MIDLSIIIPSRNDQYLNKTINDLLAKSEINIEIIVVLDGYWPASIVEDKRVMYLHHGTVHNSKGMRESINKGVLASKGRYIMKVDEHVMMDQGYDRKLMADIEDNWVVIPRRYRLEPETWTLIKDGRPPIDYMYLAYPYERPYDKTCGLHGSEWRERFTQRRSVMIDDTMSWQGSCWFTSRKHWDTVIQELDTQNYGTFTQEAQEIGNKTWLTGGRLVVNKKTWYAHYHKGNKGKGYGFSREQYKGHMEGTEKGRLYCINYWMNTKEYRYDFEWLLAKFWPVPTWPENWKERIKIDSQKDYTNSPEKKDWYANNL